MSWNQVKDDYAKLPNLTFEIDQTEDLEFFQPPLKPIEPFEEDEYLNIDFLGDTHQQHEKVDTRKLDGDILIFCGDFMKKTKKKEFNESKREVLKSFNKWIGNLKHTLKFVICGNHDEIDTLSATEIQKHLSNCIYLQNNIFELDMKSRFPKKKFSKKNEIIRIFGSPSTPFRENYWKPFSHKDLKGLWELQVPKNTNILVTHMPPLAIMDLGACRPYNLKKDGCESCGKGHYLFRHVGCLHLKLCGEKLCGDGNLKIHAYGHSHDRNGIFRSKKTGLFYVNSSLCNRKEEIVKKPIKFFFSLM